MHIGNRNVRSSGLFDVTAMAMRALSTSCHVRRIYWLMVDLPEVSVVLKVFTDPKDEGP